MTIKPLITPLRWLAFGTLYLTLSACTPATGRVPIDTMDFEQLQQLSNNTVSKQNTGTNSIRREALQETALALGAQGGLATRAHQINDMLETEQKSLDKTFNFAGLMLEQNVLPPVLVEGSDSLQITGDDAIRITDKSYRIVQQASFVTTPPNWRNYLWMSYKRPEPPEPGLLPKSTEEDKIWRHYIAVGWKNGIEQANQIYEDNLARIRRDYRGMVLYRELLSQNMVTAPFVGHSNLGITGNKNELHINDQVLRITAKPEMQLQSDTWNPVVRE